ncbi:unnamed protein product [Cuscuta campestris]|uniref:Dipeptidylpeptidase IV N-terminal domain-containing protein n=1 Tax=Cuscuta campestris TaxID=132261 RepID=A0A484KBL7_9ASTE|nr:unnamed protein product [Cuscuta campestris]
MDPRGTVAFATVGRPQYGFDIFSVQLAAFPDQPYSARPTERRLTDGVSVNFNGQFLYEGDALVFVSERSGSSQIYLQPNSSHVGKLEQLLSPSDSLFHDRPLIKKDGRLLYISAHEPPAEPFKSWSALYSTDLRQRKITRKIHVAGPPPLPEGSSSPDYEMKDRERLNHVCFSSDGEWLLFTANLGGLTAEPVSLPHQFQPYGDLYMVRLDGTALQRLTLNGYENGTPAWHPKVADDSGRKSAGQKLIGHFDEPTWITFDL